MRYSLAVADLHLVSLKTGMEDLVLPSKLYGVMAAGRPVAFIGDIEGDIAQFVETEGIGFVIGQGDGSGLAEQILSLADAPARLLTYQKNARTLFEQEFSLGKGTERWRQLLQQQVRVVSPRNVKCCQQEKITFCRIKFFILQ